MIDITIVVPIYNGEKYISSTLESLLSQDFDNYEIVIVNDGSTDNTLNEIKKIIEKRTKRGKIVRLINQENYGVSVARNTGLKNSNGKYIIFFDSDDLMDRNCLRELYNKAYSLNLDIALCGYDLIDENGETISEYHKKYYYKNNVYYGKEVIPQLLKKEISVCIGSQLFSSSFLRDNNLLFTPGATHGEDQEFSLKALYYAKRISFVQKSLVKYVQREDSVTKKKSMHQFHYVGSMKRVIKFFREKKDSSEIVTLMEAHKLPEAYINSINSLIYSDYSFKFIRNTILNNKTIKRELSNYVRIQNTLRQRTKEFLLKKYPIVYFRYQAYVKVFRRKNY